MKRQTSPQKSTFSYFNLKTISIQLVGLLLLATVITCSKKEDPTPDPITKSVPNTITVTKTVPTTVSGNVGATKSIAIYKGTTASGEVIESTFTVVGDAFTATKHASYPKDSLLLSFIKKGSGNLVQKLKSTQQVEKTDINGDGVIDTVTYTVTEKESTTTVAVELPTEELENTVTLENKEEIPATFRVVEGEIYEIPKLAGTSITIEGTDLDGEVSHEKTTSNDALIEWLESEDPTKLKFKVLGAGDFIITQTLKSPTKEIAVDTDGNGDDDVLRIYNEQESSVVTEVESIPLETVTNTIEIDNGEEIPATLEGMVGRTYTLPVLTGSAQKGEVVHDVVFSPASSIEFLGITNGEVAFKVLAEGNVTITQTLTSSTEEELTDEKKTIYTGETVEKTTTMENSEIVFGANPEGVATLQEYFAGKLVQMKEGEKKYIAFADFLDIPNPEMMNGVYAQFEVFPYGAITMEIVYEDGIWVGVNISHKYDYAGDDLEIVFTTQYNDIRVEFPIPRGVILDTSDPAQVSVDMEDHLIDMGINDQNGLEQDMVRIWGDNKSPDIFVHGFDSNSEEHGYLQEGIAAINAELEKAGSVKEDGSPFRVSIVENESAATIHLFLGDGSAFTEHYNLDEGPISGPSGLALLQYKDGDGSSYNQVTGIIVGGGVWVKNYDSESSRDLASTMTTELMTVLGFPGEINEKPTSMTAEQARVLQPSWLDKVAIRVMYSGDIKPQMSIPDFREAYQFPLEKYTQQLIDEMNAK